MLRTKSHLVLSTLIFIALAVCLGMCFEIAVVPTASMQGTILIGDHLFVSKLLDGPSIPWTSWRVPPLGKINRNQIVSFRAPGHGSDVYLKRVVAVAGDAVELRHGVLYVNGVSEPAAVPCNFRAEMARLIVPVGTVFVLGDNRDNSEDSRTFGPVPVQSIVGRPLFVLWSFRTKSSDWLDAQGQPSNTFYWTGLRHVVSATRWSRTWTRV